MLNQNRLTLSAIAASIILACAQPASAAEPFVVKDIRVEGLQRVEAGTIFGYLPVRVGDTFDDEKGAESIRALFGTGFFKDVRLLSENGVLVVLVEERPSISQIDFAGLKEFDKEGLRKSLRGVGVAEARYYDKSIMEKAEQELKRQYVARGFYGAEVTATVTPVERNRVSITFNVVEGKPAKIKEINIVGNQAFSEGKLREEMKLSTSGWLTWYTQNDQYSKQKLTADLEAIRSFYLNQGYLEFAIESTQVSITPDKREIYITVTLKEGKQFKVNDIRLAGELLGKRAELEKRVTLKKGELFSAATLAETSKSISEALGSYGYAFASISPQPNIDREKQLVDLVLMVDPGKRVYVRRINVTGNNKTRDEVIRREVRQLESSWFDGDKLRLSKDRINRTGYFSQANITTEEVPGTQDQVDVNIAVEEKPTGQFTIGAGFSSSEKVVLSTGIRQDNVFGSGTSLSLDVNTSKSNRTLALTQIDPYFTADGVSRSTDVYYRTTRPLYYTGDDQFRVATIGGSFKFGIPFSELDRVFFGLGYENTRLNLSENSPANYQRYVDAFGTQSHNVPLTIGWSRDDRDSALVPTRGHYQQANVELGLPIADLNYLRAYYQHQYFYSLGRGFTLALNGEIGYGVGYGGKKFPIFKNYFAGGIGSVRGYDTSSLGPSDPDPLSTSHTIPRGGSSKLIGNVEFIFPLPGTGVDRTLRLFAFFDAGNVFQENQGYKFSELRYSTGIGFSWISPLGPLKFSYATPLNKKPGDKTQAFQFQIGTAF